MLLWNLESADQLQELVGLEDSRLRKSLRLAQLDAEGLEYIKPLRIRKGWINTAWVIDAKRTCRPYGAGDVLRPVPEGVLILLRESDQRS